MLSADGARAEETGCMVPCCLGREAKLNERDAHALPGSPNPSWLSSSSRAVPLREYATGQQRPRDSVCLNSAMRE
jgi:hypothetical protein